MAKKAGSKKFEVLEHTADLRIKVFGSSPKELFSNALYALGYIQKPEAVEQSPVGKIIGRIRGRQVSEKISIESMDYNTLFVDFLSEVLSLSDTQNTVFFKVKFKEFSENKIQAQISGVKVNEFNEDIKAITYHQVDVKEVEPGKWESLLVFDV